MATGLEYDLGEGARLFLGGNRHGVLRVPNHPGTTNDEQKTMALERTARLLGSVSRTFWELGVGWDEMAIHPLFDGSNALPGIAATLDVAEGIPTSVILEFPRPPSIEEWRTASDEALTVASLRACRKLEPNLAKKPVCGGHETRFELGVQSTWEDESCRNTLLAVFFCSLESRGLYAMEATPTTGPCDPRRTWDFVASLHDGTVVAPKHATSLVETQEGAFFFVQGRFAQRAVIKSVVSPLTLPAMEKAFAEANTP